MSNEKLASALLFSVIIVLLTGVPLVSALAAAGDDQIYTAEVPPLVMLVMGRNHKLYYEAYNDASDLNGDGGLDVGYNPAIDYYGYFDCHKCYAYNTTEKQFEPSSTTPKNVLRGMER